MTMQLRGETMNPYCLDYFGLNIQTLYAFHSLDA